MANNYYAFTHGGTSYGSGYLGQSSVASGFPGHGLVASSYPATARAPSAYEQNYGTHSAMTNYGYPTRPQPEAVSYPQDANQYSGGNAAGTMYPYTANSPSYTNTYSSVVTNYAASALYNHHQAAVGQHDPAAAVYSSGKSNSWNFKKAIKGNKIKQAPKSQQLHYCEVCRISCAGPQTYKEHLDGQRHKKKEAQMNSASTTPNKRGQPVGVSLRCELCDVTCTGNDAYQAHIRGSKHQKVLKLHTKLGKPIPSSEPPQSKQGDPNIPHSSGKIKVLGTPKVSFMSGGRLHTTSMQENQDTSQNMATDVVKSKVSEELTTSTSNANTGSSTNTNNNSLNNFSVQEQFSQKSNYLSASDTSMMVDMEKSDSQPVGQDYVEEVRSDESKSVSFHCKLCDCRFNDPNAKEMHLKGRRHRLQYKKKVDPNLIVEIKPSMKQRKNQETKDRRFFNKQQRNSHEPYWNDWCPPPSRYGYDNRHMGPPPPPPPHVMQMPLPGHVGPIMGPPFRRNHPATSWDDNHILQKHSDICPSEADLDEIHHVVMITERALKYVSDKLSDEDAQSALNDSVRNGLGLRKEREGDETLRQDSAGDSDLTNDVQANGGQSNNHDLDKSDENQDRFLKGLMRIGPLAKNLLLVGDREVDLVVICADKPTRQILERVAEYLPKQLAVISPSEKFEIEMKVQDAALTLCSVNEPKITVNVTFTSPVVRETLLQDVPAGEMVKEPKQMLDRQKCLNALAALRHAKWYQARVVNLYPCPIIIRLLRDLCRRLPTWSKLSLWSIELLCERVSSSAGEQLNPGEAFRHVLEAIASGLLLPGGAGLLDPCEKEPTDALNYLSRQEREDITASAQHALRLIAFRQIHKILGVEPLQSRRGKRKHESDPEESVETEETERKIRKDNPDQQGSEEGSAKDISTEPTPEPADSERQG